MASNNLDKETTDVIKYFAEQIRDDKTIKSSHWERELSSYSLEEAILGKEFGYGRNVKRRKLSSAMHSVGVYWLQRRLGISADSNLWTAAKENCRIQGRAFDIDVWRHIHTLSFLLDGLDSASIFRGAVIGDGQANFSSLFFTAFPSAIVLFNVNLPEVLINEYLQLKKLNKNSGFELVTLPNYLKDRYASTKRLIVFCTPEQFTTNFKESIDLYVNIASFQEMRLEMIQKYFESMRTSTGKGFVYTCNRVSKTLPGGEVIRFDGFPFVPSDVDLVAAEPCLWQKELYTLKYPFIRPYDGESLHRLTRLNLNQDV